MIEEIARHRCEGDDATPLVVLELRHRAHCGTGLRGRIGAAWLELADGGSVRYVDPSCFEVVATGELLRHDRARCVCAIGSPQDQPAPADAVTARVERR